jgi:hypothetical protein
VAQRQPQLQHARPALRRPAAQPLQPCQLAAASRRHTESWDWPCSGAACLQVHVVGVAGPVPPSPSPPLATVPRGRGGRLPAAPTPGARQRRLVCIAGRPLRFHTRDSACPRHLGGSTAATLRRRLHLQLRLQAGGKLPGPSPPCQGGPIGKPHRFAALREASERRPGARMRPRVRVYLETVSAAPSAHLCLQRRRWAQSDSGVVLALSCSGPDYAGSCLRLIARRRCVAARSASAKGAGLDLSSCQSLRCPYIRAA